MLSVCFTYGKRMASKTADQIMQGTAAAAIEAVVRQDRGRLLSALISRLRNFQLAEDALQDALASAVVHWGRVGVPASPQGWLLRVGMRKAIDRLRSAAREDRKAAEIARLAVEEADETQVEDIADERLRLIFTCCHPALEPKTRVALTLRTLGGLSTAEVARAFLDPEPTMGQRLTRARTKITAAGIPFVVPEPEAWDERLQSVLTVVYLIFNQGYSILQSVVTLQSPDIAHSPDLCAEAIYLARMLMELRPDEAEIEGLLALLLITHARRKARVSPDGASVTLTAQDRNLWDAAGIAEGVAVLDRAVQRRKPGPFQIKAAIAAVHVQTAPTDWRQIAMLYQSLLRLEPTAVVALNHAVAVAEAGALAEGLRSLELIAQELRDYQPYHAVLADLLKRNRQWSESLAAYDRAIAMAGNSADAAFLSNRRAEAVVLAADEKTLP